jgi:hypothetical protein
MVGSIGTRVSANTAPTTTKTPTNSVDVFIGPILVRPGLQFFDHDLQRVPGVPVNSSPPGTLSGGGAFQRTEFSAIARVELYVSRHTDTTCRPSRAM